MKREKRITDYPAGTRDKGKNTGNKFIREAHLTNPNVHTHIRIVPAVSSESERRIRRRESSRVAEASVLRNRGGSPNFNFLLNRDSPPADDNSSKKPTFAAIAKAKEAIKKEEEELVTGSQGMFENSNTRGRNTFGAAGTIQGMAPANTPSITGAPTTKPAPYIFAPRRTLDAKALGKSLTDGSVAQETLNKPRTWDASSGIAPTNEFNQEQRVFQTNINDQSIESSTSRIRDEFHDLYDNYQRHGIAQRAPPPEIQQRIQRGFSDQYEAEGLSGYTDEGLREQEGHAIPLGDKDEQKKTKSDMQYSDKWHPIDITSTAPPVPPFDSAGRRGGISVLPFPDEYLNRSPNEKKISYLCRAPGGERTVVDIPEIPKMLRKREEDAEITRHLRNYHHRRDITHRLQTLELSHLDESSFGVDFNLETRQMCFPQGMSNLPTIDGTGGWGYHSLEDLKLGGADKLYNSKVLGPLIPNNRDPSGFTAEEYKREAWKWRGNNSRIEIPILSAHERTGLSSSGAGTVQNPKILPYPIKKNKVDDTVFEGICRRLEYLKAGQATRGWEALGRLSSFSRSKNEIEQATMNALPNTHIKKELRASLEQVQSPFGHTGTPGILAGPKGREFNSRSVSNTAPPSESFSSTPIDAGSLSRFPPGLRPPPGLIFSPAIINDSLSIRARAPVSVTPALPLKSLFTNSSLKKKDNIMQDFHESNEQAYRDQEEHYLGSSFLFD